MSAKDASKNIRPDVLRGHSKGIILAIACVAQFMVVLDVSIVNVAMPSIKTDLGFSTANLQWVLNAYTLAFAGLLLLGGRAADLFGRRKIYLLGLALFTFASVLGAVSDSQSMLIFARTMQGVGGAILSPTTLTIITTTFPEGKERAKALGLWSAVAGAGGAAGALFGGILTDLLSWRWIFLINIPIGILGIVLAWMYLSELKRSSVRRTLDIFGSALVTAGVTSLVFGLVRGGEIGWSATQTLLGFGVALVLLSGFVIYELKIAKDPIVPFSLFRLRALLASNVTMLFVGGSIFASWYFLSLYMQEVLGYSPLKAGLAFVPQTLAIVVGAQISSRLVSRIGPRPLIIFGPLLTAGGLFLLAGITPHSSYLGTLFLPSIMITLGMGLCFTPLAVAATGGVPAHQAGMASGLLNTARQLGGAVGLAGLSSLAVSRTASYLSSGAAHLQRTPHAALLSGLTTGYSGAMVASGVIAIGAAIGGLYIPKKITQGADSSTANRGLPVAVEGM